MLTLTTAGCTGCRLPAAGAANSACLCAFMSATATVDESEVVITRMPGCSSAAVLLMVLDCCCCSCRDNLVTASDRASLQAHHEQEST